MTAAPLNHPHALALTVCRYHEVSRVPGPLHIYASAGERRRWRQRSTAHAVAGAQPDGTIGAPGAHCLCGRHFRSTQRTPYQKGRIPAPDVSLSDAPSIQGLVGELGEIVHDRDRKGTFSLEHLFKA